MVASARLWALVPAAGAGTRMGAVRPKQYLDLCGKPVIQHTLERLLDSQLFAAVVVALAANDLWWPRLEISVHPKIWTTEGGRERGDSVLAGLKRLGSVAASGDWVLVHDAARPCVTRADIARLIEMLRDEPVGGLLALPVHDTLKRVDHRDQRVVTLDRSGVWRALTPQMFRYGLLREALETAAKTGITVTDEAAAVELSGKNPRIVEGRADNVKVTTPDDLSLAAFFLERQCCE